MSQIGRGILVLAAVGKDDTRKEAETLASKVLKLKLWDDDAGARVGSTLLYKQHSIDQCSGNAPYSTSQARFCVSRSSHCMRSRRRAISPTFIGRLAATRRENFTTISTTRSRKAIKLKE